LCISTQLIEAGVDISFDCVIRVDAGLDSIVQSGGRCNRNGESKTPQEVYVVKLKDENLGRLPEIKDGQDKTDRVFREMKNENLLSEAALTRFYKYYFYEQKSKMDYKVKELKTSIYDLLSINTLEIEGYEGQQHKGYKPIIDGLPCAFKTAAAHFSVIDKVQTGVVVPYNEEAKTLVKDFQKEYNPKTKVCILQKLQKYTVPVYSHVLQKLAEFNAVSIIDNVEKEKTFYYLNEAYYNEELGLLLEQQFPFLMVS
jgi:CRISPR-associated endonuclease/helicase Cas3